jgi:hypothetical protein
MGYSRSKATLDAIAPMLEPATHGSVVEFTHPKPLALAFKIREAFFLTTLYPDAYPALTKLATEGHVRAFARSKLVVIFPTAYESSFVKKGPRVLKQIQDAKVVTHESVLATIEDDSDDIEPPELPTVDTKTLIFHEPMSRFDVVAKWEKLQNSPATVGRKFSLTHATLTPLDLDKLARWAATNNWLVIANADSGTITLTQDDINLRTIAWGFKE